MIVVHVTHEAVEKIGGIGAVIAGLMTTDAYQKEVTRTVLLGPLLCTDKSHRTLGEGGKVIYSSVDGFMPSPWREKFSAIERTYDVGLIYGTRQISDPVTGHAVETEVLLVDVFHANRDRLNLFKGELYKKFNIPSSQFEHIWEYEEYIRLAEPGYEALQAIGVNGEEHVVLLSHEYMGMATALKAILVGARNTRTVFYAHEVASVRPIVEKRPGHDTMFYNVMMAGMAANKTVEDLFPEVFSNYKHPLVKAARYLDHVFAVGDYVEQEFRFLDPHFRTSDIDLVYNGIPSHPLTLEQKKASRERMRQYTQNLLGRRPTWIFSHVARPVLSKAFWRDLGVLHELDPLLEARGETAVYFILGTLAGQRRLQDVRHMEKIYGWPVNHENGYPDLSGGEEGMGEVCRGFNSRHKACSAILVNQWGWGPSVCGDRMPADMTFADIRHGTDLEFGMSIYEPFGISQLEPLSFGAICVTSNVCGCMGYARKVTGGKSLNIVEADYLKVPAKMSLEQLLELSMDQRNAIEAQENRRLAGLIDERLARNDEKLKKLLRDGTEAASQMSWQRVVLDYFLPSLGRAAT